MQYAQIKRPETYSAGANGLLEFEVTVDGELDSFRVTSDLTVTGGDAIFDLLLNGTSIWSGDPSQRLKILDGQATGEKPALAVAVEKGDRIKCNLVSTPSTIGPLFLTVSVAESGIGSPAPSTGKYIVAESHAELSQEIIVSRMLNHPDASPGSPAAFNDEFLTGDTLPGGAAPVWTWLNQGPATAGVSKSHLKLSRTATGGTGTTAIAALYRAIPSAPYTIQAKISLMGLFANFNYGGLILRGSDNGRLITFGLYFSTGLTGGPYSIRVARHASATVETSEQLITALPHGQVYLRIVDNSTTLSFQYSLNGYDFHEVYSEARAAYLTAGGDGAGLFINPQMATGSGFISVDSIRSI